MGSYPSAEEQSVYSTAPADWAKAGRNWNSCYRSIKTPPSSFQWRKLFLILHLQNLKEKGCKNFNLFHIIAHTVLGATNSTQTFQNTDPIKNWRWLFYLWISQEPQQKIFPYNLPWRIKIRPWCIQNITSLYTEVHEPPLHLRFYKLGLQYYTKIKFLPTNPAHDCILNPKYQLFLIKWKRQ